MSAADRRRKRCLQAIESVLDFLRRDDEAGQITQALNERFRSPSVILETDLTKLAPDLLKEPDAQFLGYIPDLTRSTRRSHYASHPKLNTLQAAAEYLKPLYIGVPIEQFYLLCLDANGRLIRCTLLQKGTIDETPFYLGHLLQSAVTTEASAIVLCHNHPGGTLRPSQADLRCTLDAISALHPLQILLLDHIIIAGEEAVSIRDTGLVPTQVWGSQTPKSKLLLNWLHA